MQGMVEGPKLRAFAIERSEPRPGMCDLPANFAAI